MNLHSYFTQQSEQKLSDERKLLLYQRICEQRSMTPQSLKRSTILTKKRVYSFLAFALFFAFFGSSFRENTEISEYRAFFAQKGFPSFGAVSATQVGEILDFNGEYIIEKEGKQFKNSVIFDGDIITLKDNAKIIFNINKHIKAEVQGPAKFTIIKLSEKKYRLSLIDGSYLKIDGEKDSDALQVETDEVLVSTEKNEALALELTKANKKTQIKNTGASLLVKNKKSKVEEQPTTLKTAKLLTMQDDDIASITDVDHFQDVFTTKKNLTHTVTLSGVSSGERVLSQEVFKDGLLSFSGTDMEFLVHKGQSVSGEVQQKISSELEYVKDEKKIPTEGQLSQITAALNKSFILSDLQALYHAKQEGDEETIQAAYRTLARRLKAIGDGYGIKVTIVQTSKEFLGALDYLHKELNNRYYLPPEKLDQLEILARRVKNIDSLESDESWEAYSSNVSQDLQFH